ncbi:MAG: serine/threonine protein kinase [Deltaproteobacteria bacterium]|nr:serine/threonine protein kinase [Deltaproteobacteria bacterium]
MAQQRYTIISKLDSGGMAEVWKGKATSMRGFEKLVAIKRVLADLAKKENFIKMFLDEARLSLHLNHANVVQTFDLGSSDDAYFIVMEWVDGINLKGVLESLKLNGAKVPLEQALFISIEVCKGLYHAHRRRTPDGEPLHIVHRDVSPPNVLISREGEVKLVDFGLAKAATQAFSTDQGMVKGKFSYLSPEAAWGKPVDERADIFAVGAVLWEMLAGRKLFEGKSNKETVLMVREAHVPHLNAYSPYVDDELMRLIRRALAQNPEERYSTAKELAQDLSRYLYKHRLEVSNYDIAELVERTLVDRKVDEGVHPSMMDDIGHLQEQLVQFTSLEDLQRMQFRAVSEDAQNAHMPANAVDPRAWADELGLSDHFTLPPIHGGARPTPQVGLRLQPVQTEQRVSSLTESSYAAPRLSAAATPAPLGDARGAPTPAPAAPRPSGPVRLTEAARVAPEAEGGRSSSLRLLLGAALLLALGVAGGALLRALRAPAPPPAAEAPPELDVEIEEEAP